MQSALQTQIPIDLPVLRNKVVLLTSATSAIALETAHVLLSQHATLVLTSSNVPRLAGVVSALRKLYPSARIFSHALDLRDLTSVRECADAIRHMVSRLDVLLFTTGGYERRPFTPTVLGASGRLSNHDDDEDEDKEFYDTDGISNYGDYDYDYDDDYDDVNDAQLGRFLLSALLVDLYADVPGARVVAANNVSRRRRRRSRCGMSMRLDGWWHSRRGVYREERFWGCMHQMRTSAVSRLANAWFVDSLNRRLRDACSPAVAVACQPMDRRIADMRRMFERWMEGGVSRSGEDTKGRRQDWRREALGLVGAACGLQEMGKRSATGMWVTTEGAGEGRAGGRESSRAERLWKESEERVGLEFRVQRSWYSTNCTGQTVVL